MAEGLPARDLVLSARRPGAGILHVMDLNERMSRDQCIRLMGSVPLGRIFYSTQALPAVELVHFTLDSGGDIVIAADAGGKLDAATRGAVVAFEADNADFAARTGWSVTVVGYARPVTDHDEIGRLERSALYPGAPGKHPHFIKVSPSIVSGQRTAAQRLAG
jgi:uncharacterized protein